MNVDGRPILTELNNGVLKSTNAMPAKDSTSDNTGSFEINRKLFKKAYQPAVNFSLRQISRSVEQRRAPALHHGFIIDGPKTTAQKKWIGGNRDASSIIQKRRGNSTGVALAKTGPQSFFSKEQNSRIEALARCRGGGSCVPPKVGARPVTFNPTPYVDPRAYFRIISAGLAAVSGITVVAPGTAYGLVPGFYKYTYTNQLGTPITTASTGGFARSYNVMTIDILSGAVVTSRYDVFNVPGQSTVLTNYLNGLSSNVIVVVATFDEPQRDNGSPLPAGLITAMNRCGASSTFGSRTGSPPGIIYYRSSYVLVGIPGCGTGNGLQRYVGSADNDPNAFVDLRISVVNGQYTYISG